jgi:hypothetical protein
VAAVATLPILVLIGFSQIGQAVPASASGLDVSRVLYVDIGTESFELSNPLAYWNLTGHTNGPRWNLVANTQQAGPYTHLAYSPIKSMWFGNPATGLYGTAGGDDPPEKDPVYSGTLTYSPTLSIPATDTLAFMTFWSWEHTEMSQLSGGFSDICFRQSICPFDVRQVWISGTNDLTWTLKWSTDRDATVEQVWHQVTINISEYVGESIRMRFAFSTDPLGQDGRSNDGRGWYIDDVHFFTFTPSEFVYLPVISRNATP